MRAATDICFLCKKNKADKTGSHFTPIGLLKNIVGKRNYEHEVTIDPQEGNIAQYFGRSNLTNTDTTIHSSDNVANHIFCCDCENKLGRIESECITLLNSFSDELINKKLILQKSKKGNLFFRFDKPYKNVAIIFFYSIIWRQMLQDFLFHGPQFDPMFFEALRLIVYNEVSSSINEIKESSKFAHYPKLIITLVDYEDFDSTGFNYGPNNFHSNPELFLIGSYQNLIFLNGNLPQNFLIATKLPDSLLDSELIINQSNDGIIAIIDIAVWNNRTKWFTAKNVDEFYETHINKIISSTGLGFATAEKFLKRVMLNLSNKAYDKDPSELVKDAAELVISTYS